MICILSPIQRVIKVQHRVLVSLLHLYLRAADLRVGCPAADLVHEPYPHPQQLCNLVNLLCLALIQGGIISKECLMSL